MGARPLFCSPLPYAQPLTGRTCSVRAIGRKERRAQFRIGKATGGTDEALSEEALFVFLNQDFDNILAIAQSRVQRIGQALGDAAFGYEPVNHYIKLRLGDLTRTQT